ncbi:MAG: antitoxin Xre/MbcA/ParS toxin-binding domain-containing protein [Rhizobacter sp.]
MITAQPAWARIPASVLQMNTGRDTPPQPIAPVRKTDLSSTPSSQGFIALLVAYRATGGTTPGDELARLLGEHQRGDFASLAGHIASHEIFGFEWRSTLWIPMFQFDLRDLAIKPGSRQVLAELAKVFDGWGVAAWFAQPNSWLNGRSPVDLVDSQLGAVLDAARADRFVAAG